MAPPRGEAIAAPEVHASGQRLLGLYLATLNVVLPAASITVWRRSHSLSSRVSSNSPNRLVLPRATSRLMRLGTLGFPAGMSNPKRRQASWYNIGSRRHTA